MGLTSVDPWNVNNILFLKCLNLCQLENVILLIFALRKDEVRIDGNIFCSTSPTFYAAAARLVNDGDVPEILLTVKTETEL